MKGVSSAVAAVIIATISVALVGTTYLFSKGMIESATAETFELIDMFGNKIIIKNAGTQPISKLKILIDGNEVENTIEGGSIEPGKIGTIVLTNLEGIQSGYHDLMIISNSMSQTFRWQFTLVTTTISGESTTSTITATSTSTTTTEEIGGQSIEISVNSQQGTAEIGKPVKWTSKIDVKNPSNAKITDYLVNLTIPKDAEDVVIKDSTEQILTMNENFVKVNITEQNYVSYSAEYETPAPYKEENIIQSFTLGEVYRKNVVVKSDFSGHYKNVKAYTNIPEELSKENYIIKLYSVSGFSKIDLTDNIDYNVRLVDSDNNGLTDRIEWTVPILSEEIFEVKASINIINIQSYPTVYGNWTVRFNTTGTADLTITPINDTNFDVDIRFLELRCGDRKIDPVYDGKSVLYVNWDCTEEGSIINQVLKEGKHTLEFKFGEDVEYAYNQAVFQYYINTAEAEQSTGTSWREALSLTWDDPQNTKWLILTSWESRHSLTTADGNYQVSKDGVEQALYTERVSQANNEYISYFFPQIHEGDGGTIKYNISFNTASGTAYIRRVRIVAIRLDNLQNTHYNYNFNEIATGNLDSTWGGAEDTTVTISPSTAGWYLILASLAKNSDNTGRSVVARLVVDSEFIPSLTPNNIYGSIEDTAITEFHPFQVIAARQLSIGDHTISLQAISELQSAADIRDRSVIAVRLSDVFTFFSTSDVGETSTTSTTSQNKSTLTIPSGNDGDYLILSMFTLKGSTTYTNPYDYESRTFSDDYGEIGKFERFRSHDASDYITSGMVYNTTFDANQHIIKNQYRREDASGTASAKSSEIIAIKLNSSVVSAGWLNTTLDIPEPTICNATTPCEKTQYETFWVNATIECESGSCGTVSGAVRYNDSLNEPNLLIDTAEGAQPFYILGEQIQFDEENYVYKNWNFSISGQGTNSSDVAYNGTHFWVIFREAGNTRVYRYKSEGTYDNWNVDLSSDFSAVEGLYVNKTNIIVSGLTPASQYYVFVYTHDGTANEVQSFSVNGQISPPVVAPDVTTNGTYYWVLSSGTNADYIYRYRLDGTYDNWRIDISAYFGGDGSSLFMSDGMDFNGTNFFVAESGKTTDVIHWYSESGNYLGNFSIAATQSGAGRVMGLTLYDKNWPSSYLIGNDKYFYVVEYKKPFIFRYEKNTSTAGFNPISCGPLNQGQKCQLSWNVNVTASSGDYKIDVNFSSNSYPNVMDNDTSNAYIRVGGGLSFAIQLPGQFWVSSSKTEPGSATTAVEFNATSKTQSNVIPCVHDTNCVFKQDDTTPIFKFQNTGNGPEKWNISINETLPSYMTLIGDTDNNPAGATTITKDGWIVNSNIPKDGIVDVWLWATYTDASPETRPIRILHRSMPVP